MNSESSLSPFQKLASILHALSDEYALEILEKAETGFKSGKSTIKDLRLTPRRYYRKLKELNELGILISTGDEYKLTQLGTFLRKLLLNHALSLLVANQNQLLPMEKVGNLSEVTVIDDYDKLVDFLVAAIDKSKSEILLATRYLDFVVIQRLISALERNVNVKTVTSTKVDLGAIIKLLGDALFSIRPNVMKFLAGKGNYRSGEVPFSLIVVDNELVVFEVPNKKFKSAFVCMDRQIVQILSGLFRELWNQSEALRVFPS